MNLYYYTPQTPLTYTEHDIEIRERFVFEFMRDGNPRQALVRMGQPVQLLDQMVEYYMNDVYIANKIQDAREGFASKVLNGDGKLQGMVLSELWFNVTQATKATERNTAIALMMDYLRIKDGVGDGVVQQGNLTKEQVRQELIKRGYGDITLENQFSRRI